MSKSEQLFEKAQKVIPGGVNSPVRAFKGVGGTPVFIEKAEGAYIIDSDGKRISTTLARGARWYWGTTTPQLLMPC